ncbi:BF3164 family lipoprotein [Bacteroides sp. 224]|uniref:BF3164 family lipoprotein n=1 Tax=Bacteroides sp. 224 TaxID=2302936 RepID=UPI0013D60781|nr:BF3164 family lipoprotein [Bacteroides sp. 224]NDV66547.1 hypothetical protein [Bacteroides sp. 224]
MRIFFYVIFCFLFFCSCNVNNKKESSKSVERISVNPIFLTNELLSNLPGTLLVYEKEIAWLNHSSLEGFVSIFDKQTGDEITSFGRIGEGPEEVFTPQLAKGVNNSIIVYDLNSYKVLFYSLDSLLNGNKMLFNVEKWEEMQQKLRLIQVDSTSYVLFGTEDNKPFLFLNNNNKSYFGHYPIKHSDEISNRMSIFQGVVSYNSHKQYLLYSVGGMSYLALYEYANGMFNQKWEKHLSEVEYTITNNKMKITKTPKYAPTALCLTKDYIVTIERDKENATPLPPKKTKGRDFSRAPQTLFVYDYDMNLLKIVNLGLPVLSVASDDLNNDVFFIGADPELCLGKCAI